MNFKKDANVLFLQVTVLFDSRWCLLCNVLIWFIWVGTVICRILCSCAKRTKAKNILDDDVQLEPL